MSRVTLGDVAIERRESCKGDKSRYPVVGLEHLTPEEINLTAWDKSGENTFTKIFHKGDILFGRRRAYLKKAALAPFDGICSGDITVIEAKSDYILPELLPFVIQNDAFFDFAVGKSAGSLSPRVKWEHLKEYEFNLPSIKEHRSISKILWSVNDTIEAYKKLTALTDELVKAYFSEKIEGQYPYTLLGNEIKTTSGGTPSRKKREYYDNGTIPWLTSGEINQGIISHVENCITEEGLANSSAKWIPANSVVIAMYGATAGAVGLLRIATTTNQAVCSLLPNDDFEPLYLYKAVSQKKDWMVAKTIGAAQPNISQTIIKNMTITKPPLHIQKQFADFVQQSDKSKSELEQAMTTAKAMMKKIIAENLW